MFRVFDIPIPLNKQIHKARTQLQLDKSTSVLGAFSVAGARSKSLDPKARRGSSSPAKTLSGAQALTPRCNERSGRESKQQRLWRCWLFLRVWLEKTWFWRCTARRGYTGPPISCWLCRPWIQISGLGFIGATHVSQQSHNEIILIRTFSHSFAVAIRKFVALLGSAAGCALA